MPAGLGLLRLGLAHTAANPKAHADPATFAFSQQRPLVESAGRRDVAILGRQSGKTTAAALRAWRVAALPHARRVTYVTRTRKNAKRLFWGPLLEWGRKLGYKVADLVNLTDLTIQVPHADGSFCTIELLGAHDIEQIGDLRGTQYDLVIVDEAQLIRPMLLEVLLGEVIFPGCRARRGSVLLIGTPGPVKFGPFFNAWSDDRWAKWHWTAWDNPNMPEGEVDREISDLHLLPTDARYVREYLGQWYDGYDEGRVWDYGEERNSPTIELPRSAKEAGPLWEFSWGIDLASSTDNDALVVVGWRLDDPLRQLFEVDAWQAPGTEDYEDLKAVLKQKRDQWEPSIAIGDSGGHGAKKIVNTISRRVGVRMLSKPTSVEATIRLMNNDLRGKRYFVRRGGDLAQDMQMEAWEVSKSGKRTIGGGKHSDLTAAARYAYEAARAYQQEGPEAPLNEEQAFEARRLAREQRENGGEF